VYVHLKGFAKTWLYPALPPKQIKLNFDMKLSLSIKLQALKISQFRLNRILHKAR